MRKVLQTFLRILLQTFSRNFTPTKITTFTHVTVHCIPTTSDDWKWLRGSSDQRNCDHKVIVLQTDMLDIQWKTNRSWCLAWQNKNILQDILRNPLTILCCGFSELEPPAVLSDSTHLSSSAAKSSVLCWLAELMSWQYSADVLRKDWNSKCEIILWSHTIQLYKNIRFTAQS